MTTITYRFKRITNNRKSLLNTFDYIVRWMTKSMMPKTKPILSIRITWIQIYIRIKGKS